jgi:hypothetical protein
MEFEDFLRKMLGVTEIFAITSIDKDEANKEIKVYLKYLKAYFSKGGKDHRIYDLALEREWQHLNRFEYRCYLVCRLPRYLAEDGKPKVIGIHFAPRYRGYTHPFAERVVEALQAVKVQKTVTRLMNTTDYIVRSIMEDAVGKALQAGGGELPIWSACAWMRRPISRGTGTPQYPSMPRATASWKWLMPSGRRHVKAPFFRLNSEEKPPALNRGNMGAWQPYMNAIDTIAT